MEYVTLAPIRASPKNPQLGVVWIRIQLTTLLVFLELVVKVSKGDTNKFFLSKSFYWKKEA